MKNEDGSWRAPSEDIALPLAIEKLCRYVDIPNIAHWGVPNPHKLCDVLAHPNQPYFKNMPPSILENLKRWLVPVVLYNSKHWEVIYRRVNILTNESDKKTPISPYASPKWDRQMKMWYVRKQDSMFAEHMDAFGRPSREKLMRFLCGSHAKLRAVANVGILRNGYQCVLVHNREQTLAKVNDDNEVFRQTIKNIEVTGEKEKEKLQLSLHLTKVMNEIIEELEKTIDELKEGHGITN